MIPELSSQEGFHIEIALSAAILPYDTHMANIIQGQYHPTCIIINTDFLLLILTYLPAEYLENPRYCSKNLLFLKNFGGGGGEQTLVFIS